MRTCLYCAVLCFGAGAAAQPDGCDPCDFAAGAAANKAAENRHIKAGTVKSYTPGREITVDLPMAFDKSFDLSHSNPKVRIRVSDHITTGDPVAIIEYDEGGVHCVDIVPQADISDGFEAHAAAAGTVTEYVAGERIALRLSGGGARTFDLRRRTGAHVVVAGGILTGDPVCVFEGERNKQRVVRIEKGASHAGDTPATKPRQAR